MKPGGWIAFLALLALPAWAEKMTQADIDGHHYSQITDVHVVSGGRIVVLFDGGGITVTPDKVSTNFLSSWGVSLDDVAKSRQAAERGAEVATDQAIAAGYFREVDGVAYDLRRPQGDWMEIAGAKIVTVTEEGALINTTPLAEKPTLAFIRNLPKIYTDNQTISVTAKAAGTFTFMAGERSSPMQHTVRAYDLGRPLQKTEIPAAMIKQGLAAAILPNAVPHRQRFFDSEGGEVRATGSGFFITADGYLLTNFHVVKDAARIEVKSKEHTQKAEVAMVDQVNDLALLKVSGSGYKPLQLTTRAQEDLGESVFTIGFPNIETQGMAPKYTDGKISSLAGMLDDPSQYQISVPVQPGNSGGPLCDSSGTVVGVIVARLNDLAMLRTEGVIPQNVNYAIKMQCVTKLLRKAPDLDASLPKGAPGRAANPVQSVQDSVALVMIY